MRSRFFIGLASTLITIGVLAATLGPKRYAHYKEWRNHHAHCRQQCWEKKANEKATDVPITNSDSTTHF